MTRDEGEDPFEGVFYAAAAAQKSEERDDDSNLVVGERRLEGPTQAGSFKYSQPH